MCRTFLTNGSLGLSIDRDHPHLPPGFTALGQPAVAPHLSAYVSFIQKSSTDVRYLVGQARQVCYRDRGNNVICSFLHKKWDER